MTSFAFASRTETNITVRKEKMQRGGAYWYGHKSLRGKTVKRYIGRPADLSIARLEEIAANLRSKPLNKKAHADGVGQWLAPVPNLPAPTATDSSSEPGSAQMIPLLDSKLYPPRPSASLVARPRLYVRLDAGTVHKLTLLSTPAGFGKTTAVSQWLAERNAGRGRSSNEALTTLAISTSVSPVAWVTLDEGDNDPVRFLRYVIAACQTIHPEVGRSALALLSYTLRPPFELPPPETLLTFMLNDIGHYVSNGLLILDDYHVITEVAIHETMTFFIDHLPGTMHVMILTRSEPPLPLLRWRAHGEIQDIRTADLRFSSEETTTFLRQLGPAESISASSLSPATIQRLTERLEGWPAGLRLLLLSLQGQKGQRGIEQSLAQLVRDPIASGNSSVSPQRAIEEYFISEVLNTQPESLQRFLLQTSVLGHLTGSLCDSVTGTENSATLLAAVERAGLFLESLDGPLKSEQWYRYHALFVEAMQSEAQRRFGDTRLRELSLLAGKWYQQHGMPIEAVEAMLRAREVERAVTLIEAICEQENFYEPHTLLHWLKQVPEAVLPLHPTLCFYYALALLFTRASVPLTLIKTGRMTEWMDAMLQMAERGWSQSGNLSRLGEVFAFRALVAWQTDELGSAAGHARKALELLPIPLERRRMQDMQWRSVCLAVLGMEAAAERGLDEARQFLMQAYESCSRAQNRGFTRATIMMLASVDLACGELHQPAEAIRQVISEAREVNDWGDVTYGLFTLSGIFYEWNDLGMVEQLANEAYEIGKHGLEAEMREFSFLRLALVQHRRGGTRAAHQQLITLLARLLTLSSAPLQLIFEVLNWLIRLQLTLGDLSAAQRHFEIFARYEKQASAALLFMRDMLQVRLLLARGEMQAALARLESSLRLASAKKQMRYVLEILILMTQAYDAGGQGLQARTTLQRALSQAHSEGFIRFFIDEGEPLAAALRSLLPTIKDKELNRYIQQLLRNYQVEQDNIATSVPTLSSDVPDHPDTSRRALNAPDRLPLEPLSAQERRVLRLLVAGLTNPEIASELVISVNTVKDHVKHLYNKLQVNNRIAASEAARRLQLS